MDIFKVKLDTTNALGDTAWDKINDKYIDVKGGYIYVTRRDLDYVIEHFNFISIEAVGLIFERPCEISSLTDVEIVKC